MSCNRGWRCRWHKSPSAKAVAQYEPRATWHTAHRRTGAEHAVAHGLMGTVTREALLKRLSSLYTLSVHSHQSSSVPRASGDGATIYPLTDHTRGDTPRYSRRDERWVVSRASYGGSGPSIGTHSLLCIEALKLSTTHATSTAWARGADERLLLRGPAARSFCSSSSSRSSAPAPAASAAASASALAVARPRGSLSVR